MARNGWIKLHRKLLEKGYWDKSQYVHLWLHLLLTANHQPNEYMTNGKIILIKEGQLVTGRKQLSLATGIPESTVEDILRLFENEQQIQQQKTTKYRLITVLNWKDYQESDNKATTKQQQADTIKNNKKEKNTSELASEIRVVQDSSFFEENERPRKPAKYPNARTVFSWFPQPQQSWKIDTAQNKYAELLFLRGEPKVRNILKYLKEHHEDDFCPQVTKPSDLEKKWEDIVAYANKN